MATDWKTSQGRTDKGAIEADFCSVVETDPIVHLCYTLYKRKCFDSLEDMLKFCIVRLVDANQTLTKRVVDALENQPMRFIIQEEEL